MYGVQDVTVRFGETTALRDVTVKVTPGSVVTVVGGDGAGKSTLLRTVVREVRPSRGLVRAPGKDALGFLPASAGSWGGLSVTQNLDFAGGVYGLTGQVLATRRDALLERAGLADASTRLASQLSGGMRRKLGVCMAMIGEPELLVLDEPSTGVDPVSRVDLWRLASEAAAGGAAVLIATTYLDEAERAAHLAVLDAGEVLTQGPYDAVRAAFTGVVTHADQPQRPAWSWRRGRDRREYWPDGEAPAHLTQVAPDLQDIVIALTLVRRARAGAAA